MNEDFGLNEVQENLMVMLFCYRGATAVQLAKMIYQTDAITTSNEKYVYGQLNKLESDGLVTRFKPNVHVSKYAIYYLTKKGFDWYQNSLDLPEGYVGKGWLFDTDIDFGEFEYTVYKPPLKQIKHHLMLIDTFLVMQRASVVHRNNLYAKREMLTPPNIRSILRADAEMKINDQIYTIEIDCGTESHAQLVEKFNNYFEYITDYRNAYGHYDIHNIVFVVSGTHDGHLKRRWTNILAAYYKGMRGIQNHVNLYLVIQDDLAKFLEFEKQPERHSDYLLRRVLHERKGKFVENLPETEYFNRVSCIFNHLNHTHVVHYQISSTPYSSRNSYIIKESQKIENKFLYCVGRSPFITNELERYGVSEEILRYYLFLDTYKFDMVLKI